MSTRTCLARLLPLLLLASSGCIAPSDRLDFPRRPLVRTDRMWGYDVNRNGKVDFALFMESANRLDHLAYDDDEDGTFDRVYRLSDYAPDQIPHVVLMLDTIPFEAAHRWFGRGEFPWMHPPVKLIPPFPSMSEVTFSDILHSAPQRGMVNRYYNRHLNAAESDMWGRVTGELIPLERFIDYSGKYSEWGMSCLDPRPWFAAEMARAARAFNENPRRDTLLYIGTASSMVCKYGTPGADEVLDAAQQFCLQLLHARQGAVHISMCADHGHNGTAGEFVDMEAVLGNEGFRVTDELRGPGDVIMDAEGLVTYAGFHTLRPAKLAEALARRKEVQLATYLKQDVVIVRSADGVAEIRSRGGRLAYVPVEGDALGYKETVAAMVRDGRADAEGFADAEAWLGATADHRFPDAPVRLWRSFHGLVLHPPDVMVAFNNEYLSGTGSLRMFITMQATHGGLDDVNSVTFAMSTTNRLKGPLRSGDLLPALLPGYVPILRR